MEGINMRGPRLWRPPSRSLSFALMVGSFLIAGCTSTSPPPQEAPIASLQELGKERILIGTAVAGGQTSPALKDPQYTEWLSQQFGSLTPENQMKFRALQPRLGEFRFGGADAVVDFARKNGKKVRGHTLIWHAGNPEWLQEGNLSCDEVRQVLKNHIDTVLPRYRDVVYQWDVANEIVNSGGEPRTSENPFIRACGLEIVEDAFRWAHEAAPNAKLYLNDYRAESSNRKFDGYVKLVQRFKQRNVPVHGFGFQAHVALGDESSWTLRKNMETMTSLGLDVAVTEAEVRLSHRNRPSRSELDRQAQAYADILNACLVTPRCSSFTMWGFTDKYSWLNSPSEDEGSSGVLDADFAPKPAFTALVDALRPVQSQSTTPLPPRLVNVKALS